MSNFTFFPQCFPCIFKSFNCHISVVVCSFFEFGTVSQNAVLGNGSKGYLLLNYLSLTEEETEEEEEEEEVFAVFDFISVISQRQLVFINVQSRFLDRQGLCKGPSHITNSIFLNLKVTKLLIGLTIWFSESEVVLFQIKEILKNKSRIFYRMIGHSKTLL